MADSVPLIDAAIYARLGTIVYAYPNGSGGTVTGSVNVYNTQAVQQTATPYIVFQMQSGVDDYHFGTGREESFDYVVRAVSLSDYPAQQANPIYDAAHTALQDAPLSVAGYQVQRVRRISRIRYRDSQRFWHVGGLYRINLSKT